MENNEIRDNTYFAAANGYGGFRSNFNAIFSPEELDKLFIIKGGPGTGKSTLMKKIKERYSSSASIITILCSSDPDSLDGILIKKNGVTIGIADGTAPHVIDAKYPGVIEEIVNLGDGFDFSKLRQRKDEVLDYAERKANEYKKAYDSLKIAGEIYKYTTNTFSKYANYTEAEGVILGLIKDEKPSLKVVKKEPFLLDAFCRKGRVIRGDLETDKQIIRIGGDGLSEQFFMTLLFKILCESNIPVRVFASAFADDDPYLIETPKAVYTIASRSNAYVNTEQFIDGVYDYWNLKKSYDTLLNSAKEMLCNASEYHFKLEDIYADSISFDKNDEKYANMVKEIDSLFDK